MDMYLFFYWFLCLFLCSRLLFYHIHICVLIFSLVDIFLCGYIYLNSSNNMSIEHILFNNGINETILTWQWCAQNIFQQMWDYTVNFMRGIRHLIWELMLHLCIKTYVHVLENYSYFLKSLLIYEKKCLHKCSCISYKHLYTLTKRI